MAAEILELAQPGGGHREPAPAAAGPVEHGEHQAQAGRLAGEPPDDLDASAGFAERPLDEVGVLDAAVVLEREAQVGRECVAVGEQASAAFPVGRGIKPEPRTTSTSSVSALPARRRCSARGSAVPVLRRIAASAAAGALSRSQVRIAVLPAVAAGAGAAFGALKIGTLGFGDAIKATGDPKKFAEAIKSLSPAARETAVAVRDLQPAFQAQLDDEHALRDDAEAGGWDSEVARQAPRSSPTCNATSTELQQPAPSSAPLGRDAAE